MKMQSLQWNKKGQNITLSNIGTLILVVGTATVMAVIVSILIAQLQTDQRTTTSETITNESNLTVILSGNPFVLSNTDSSTGRPGFAVVNDSSFLVINASITCSVGTGCERVENTNFTILGNGTITLVSLSHYNDTELNFTYTFGYTNLDSVYNISGAGLSFFNNLSSQWGLLGTVIGLVLIVSLIMGGLFGGIRRRSGLK